MSKIISAARRKLGTHVQLHITVDQYMAFRRAKIEMTIHHWNKDTQLWRIDVPAHQKVLCMSIMRDVLDRPR